MKLPSLLTALAVATLSGGSFATDFSAYYSFEGQGQGYKDISSNGHDGYFLNSSHGNFIVDGRNGLAIQNDVLVVGSLPAHKKDMPFTLALWIKPEEAGLQQTLLAKLDAVSNQGFQLGLTGSGISFQLADKVGGQLAVSASTQPSVGRWSHIAVTYSGSGRGSGVKLFVDGIELTATVNTDNLTGATDTFGPFYIGAKLTAPKPFSGAIDEVLVAPKAYSVGQIGCLATFGSDCATAVGYGPRGEVGPRGPQGEPGLQGEAGLQGPVGETGPRGEAGSQGPVGPQGDRGDIGLAGDQGPAGANGINGADGLDGLPGAPGIKGEKGRIGLQGDTGDVGPNGPTGAKGSKGAVGERGDTGPAGDKGLTGPAGPTGDSGARGVAGRKGIQGPIGDAGNRGPQGPQGIKGTVRGPTGKQGLQGLSYGHLTGPDGLKGPVGPKGYAGPMGQCLCYDRYGRPCLIP